MDIPEREEGRTNPLHNNDAIKIGNVEMVFSESIPFMENTVR